MSMGIKKVLLSLGLCSVVSVFGMSAANAAPADDDQARQECPEGQKCDRPAPDQKKLKKGEERRDEAASEGKAPRKAKKDADDDRAASGDEGRAPAKAMKNRSDEEDRDAPRDEKKQPKDQKKKPPKPEAEDDQDQ